MKFSSIILAATMLFAASFVTAIPDCDVACRGSAKPSDCSNRCAICIPAINAGWIGNDGSKVDCSQACHGAKDCIANCTAQQDLCCHKSNSCCPGGNTAAVCYA